MGVCFDGGRVWHRHRSSLLIPRKRETAGQLGSGGLADAVSIAQLQNEWPWGGRTRKRAKRGHIARRRRSSEAQEIRI